MTDWNSLDGLELRRAVLELLGGYPDLKMRWFSNDAWTGEVHPSYTNEKDMEYEEELQWQELSYTKETEPRVAPRIESSADMSERIFVEECDKRGYTYVMTGTYAAIDEFGNDIDGVVTHLRLINLDGEDRIATFGSTPSLARARAIGILLERDPK